MVRTSALRRLLQNVPRGRRIALCVLVGVVAGCGAIGFFYLLETSRCFFLDYLAGYSPGHAGYEQPPPPADGSQLSAIPVRRWALLFIPALGGLISGLIVFTLAPEAEGHGTDAAIQAYHFKGGLVRARVPLVKALTSAITIGSGGSGGREGPIAQIGSGFGSVVAQWLRLNAHERRILMGCGMGAGIGAIFHAPLAGAIFAGEVMYRELDIEHELLVPAFIGAIVAYAVFGSAFGFHPLFITPNYQFNSAPLLVPYFLLALVCAGGAIIYVRTFYGVRGLFMRRLRMPNHVKPALGGLFVGVIGFFLPEALGTGYGVVQACFHEPTDSPVGGLVGLPSWSPLAAVLPAGTDPLIAGMLLLALIGVAKIGTTALSIGSGGSGGVFGPAVVIGGALGGATGLLCQQLFPELPVRPGAFALVGMAGFFAGAANTPISTIIMTSEMTGNYNLLVPAMLVCIVSYLLCQRHNLYEMQLSSHFEAPAQIGNMATAVLRQLQVSHALAARGGEPPVVVSQSMPLREVMKHFTRTTQAALPVIDDKQRLKGIIDTRDIRRIARETTLDDVLIASDIVCPAPVLTRRDSLLAAIRRMVASRTDELVVVDEHDQHCVIGLLSRADIVAAYDRTIQSARADAPLAP